MAITSRELRGRLEDAYAASAGLPQPTSLRAYLRTQEQNARAAISGGSVVSAMGDGKSVEFSKYGPGDITTLEVVELWRTLIDRFDDSLLFVASCTSEGLDAFQVEFTFFPNAGATPPLNQGNIVDATGRWANLCFQFGIAQNQIVGQPISDKAIFLWMMFHEVAVKESFGDFSQMRIGQGAQFT